MPRRSIAWADGTQTASWPRLRVSNRLLCHWYVCHACELHYDGLVDSIVFSEHVNCRLLWVTALDLKLKYVVVQSLSLELTSNANAVRARMELAC